MNADALIADTMPLTMKSTTVSYRLISLFGSTSFSIVAAIVLHSL
jgi:hypothetical protein